MIGRLDLIILRFNGCIHRCTLMRLKFSQIHFYVPGSFICNQRFICRYGWSTDLHWWGSNFHKYIFAAPGSFICNQRFICRYGWSTDLHWWGSNFHKCIFLRLEVSSVIKVLSVGTDGPKIYTGEAQKLLRVASLSGLPCYPAQARFAFFFIIFGLAHRLFLIHKYIIPQNWIQRLLIIAKHAQ